MYEMIGEYKNGNYNVRIYSDGTKVRYNDKSKLIPSFAESVDLTITNKCDGQCGYCYAGCTPTGCHAEIINVPFMDTLHPYTEMAIGVNDLTHPQLDEFFNMLKSKKVIANITVNQRHFMKHYDRIKKWADDKLVYGVGISLQPDTKDFPEFIDKVKSIPNSVLHTINGILTERDINALSDKGVKILILGYKNLGRGIEHLKSHLRDILVNQAYLKQNLGAIFYKFNCVSFDNLALEQLDVKSHVSENEWNQLYMGDEGQYTFFIDLVNGFFSKSSLDTKVSCQIMDSIDEMFNYVREFM